MDYRDTLSQPYSVPDDVCNAVQTLLDTCLVSHPSLSDETFTECLMCGDWEDHKPGCIVPALLQWQAE